MKVTTVDERRFPIDSQRLHFSKSGISTLDRKELELQQTRLFFCDYNDDVQSQLLVVRSSHHSLHAPIFPSKGGDVPGMIYCDGLLVTATKKKDFPFHVKKEPMKNEARHVARSSQLPKKMAPDCPMFILPPREFSIISKR
jgi:hypothetical protein